MSRYTKKPHGLSIGWDNNFFYFAVNPGENESRTFDFPCIVSIERYYYDNAVAYSINNGIGIQSPAEQLLIALRKPERDEVVQGEDLSDFDFSYFEDESLREKLYESRMNHRQPIAEPTELARKWLDANAPGWGCPENYRKDSFAFFFAKKSHANAFCKWVDSILCGQHYLHDKRKKTNA